MNIKTISWLEDLIDQISINNNPGTLDDDYPDMLAENFNKSAQELVDYIAEHYNVYAKR